MKEGFSSFLERARCARGMKRAGLAERIGCSESSVFRYERGLQVPSRKQYVVMQELLNLPRINYDVLFYEKDGDGACILLSLFWQQVRLGSGDEAEQLLSRLIRLRETASIDRDLECEITLAKELLFYDCYDENAVDRRALVKCMLMLNDNAPVDPLSFQQRLNDGYYSLLEMIGYNLYGLLLLSEGRYELPQVIFSSLLYNEKQKEYRDLESKNREVILAGNLGLCHLLRGACEEALAVCDRYADDLFLLGGMALPLFFEFIRLNCYARLSDEEKYEEHYAFAKKLYLRCPFAIRETYTFEEFYQT